MRELNIWDADKWGLSVYTQYVTYVAHMFILHTYDGSQVQRLVLGPNLVTAIVNTSRAYASRLQLISEGGCHTQQPFQASKL